MPIFVWIYRITWIQDKTGFFFIFLIFSSFFLIFPFNWYNCFLKYTRTGSALVEKIGQKLINIQVQNFGKTKSSPSKNFISIFFFKPKIKIYIYDQECESLFIIVFHLVELLKLFMINKMFNFINGNWKIKCTWQEHISQIKVRRKLVQKTHVYKSSLKSPVLWQEPWFELKVNQEKGKE